MITEWISGHVFKLVHRKNLVYNCCWEDPRLDRVALNLKPTDTVAMITSAGCNALDYALDGPKQIYAVDVNFRQNALLELKLVAIRTLQFEDFFDIFGRGRSSKFSSIYQTALRNCLNPVSRDYWDERMHYFSGQGRWGSFYYRGTTGLFARALKSYIDRKPKVREALDELFTASSLQEQSQVYFAIRGAVWSRLVRWLLGRDSALAMLGIPRPQRVHLERNYPGGIVKFIEDCIEAVFTKLPLRDNYFWRLYAFGEYSPTCCPEYLKENNFYLLKGGPVEAIQTLTCTMTQFLREHEESVSKLVLLDHMDWLNIPARRSLLGTEWQAIVDRAAKNARIIWRSAGLDGRFVDSLTIKVGGRQRSLAELLSYQSELASNLHVQDRVHTYGSFCIADLVA